ncbi:MAG TPA: ABC transporter permease [Spirochaetia bacterium]|nr:ABC transporter permease [Spirochaetia bacterium]
MGVFGRAIRLLVCGDAEVWFITWTSLRFSLSSTLLACVPGIPLGVLIALRRFRGRRALLAVLSSLMALPTVVVGLIVYSLVSRVGPLGGLRLLFTPGAVIIGQAILAFPIVLAMTASALSSLNPLLPEVLTTLGATRRGIFWMSVREARGAVLSAALAAFGRVVGEVGAAMMLGGNIRWYTRTITTAIALETGKGEFELGLALGIILMAMALGVNALLHWAVRHE